MLPQTDIVEGISEIEFHCTARRLKRMSPYPNELPQGGSFGFLSTGRGFAGGFPDFLEVPLNVSLMIEWNFVPVHFRAGIPV